MQFSIFLFKIPARGEFSKCTCISLTVCTRNDQKTDETNTIYVYIKWVCDIVFNICLCSSDTLRVRVASCANLLIMLKCSKEFWFGFYYEFSCILRLADARVCMDYQTVQRLTVDWLTDGVQDSWLPIDCSRSGEHKNINMLRAGEHIKSVLREQKDTALCEGERERTWANRKHGVDRRPSEKGCCEKERWAWLVSIVDGCCCDSPMPSMCHAPHTDSTDVRSDGGGEHSSTSATAHSAVRAACTARGGGNSHESRTCCDESPSGMRTIPLCMFSDDWEKTQSDEYAYTSAVGQSEIARLAVEVCVRSSDANWKCFHHTYTCTHRTNMNIYQMCTLENLRR